MNKYDILPKIKTFPVGSLFKVKEPFHGIAKIHDGDGNEVEEEVVFTVGTIATFIEDEQYMASSKEYSMSAHLAFTFLYNERKVKVLILRTPSRVWNFNTYMAKQRLMKEEINKILESVEMEESK